MYEIRISDCAKLCRAAAVGFGVQGFFARVANTALSMGTFRDDRKDKGLSNALSMSYVDY